MMKKLTVLLFVLSITTLIFGQAPQGFNYQGIARDLSGNPLVNKNIGLRIAIIQDTVNGEEVYKEIHAIITNDLGLFNIKIGFGSIVYGSFEDIDWGSGDYFIQIEIDENGGGNYQLIGTSQLMSVPYALFSRNASKWSENENGINYDEGNVGIGTSSPTSILHLKKPFGDVVLTLETDEDNLGEDDNPRIDFLQDGETVGFKVGLNQELNLLTSGNDFYFQPIWLSELKTPILTLSIDDGVLGAAHYNARVGIGTATPKSKLQITGGDIYLEEIESGVIMKSPDGNCWKLTVDNLGNPVFTSIDCPE